MKRRYTGILAEPIVWDNYFHKTTILNEACGDRARSDAEGFGRAMSERVAALYRHFEIDPESQGLAVLLVALASEHVPGFRIIRKRKSASAERTKWDALRLSALLVAVELLRRKKRNGINSDRAATKHIAANSATYGSLTLGTKSSRLKELVSKARKEAHNPLAPFVLRALDSDDAETAAAIFLDIKFPIAY